jgi:hypothetical protein
VSPFLYVAIVHLLLRKLLFCRQSYRSKLRWRCSTHTHGSYSPTEGSQMPLIPPATSGLAIGTHDKVQGTMSSSTINKATTSTKRHEISLLRCHGPTNAVASAWKTSSHCYEGLNLRGTYSLVSAPSAPSTTKSTASSTSPPKTATAKGSPAATFGAGACLTNTERPLIQ